MTARQLPRTDYAGLKSAWRELVDTLGGDAHASRVSRVSAVQMGRYGSIQEDFDEVFSPVDIVADLESEVGPIVTRELARLTNHALVELPKVSGGTAPLTRISGAALKEVGEVFNTFGRQIEDDVLDSVEGMQLVKEIDEAIVQLLTFKLHVQLITAGAGQ